jgi:nucleoid-associated protein YgaU
MATKPKSNSKTIASGAKGKAISKAASKSVKTSVASKKPASKPKTIAKIQQKDSALEKKSAQATAFDKKIDQMSQPGAKSGKKGKRGVKITIAVIIIIILAAVAYKFFPVKKNMVVKEDITPKEEPPVHSVKETPAVETKIPETAKKEVKPASDVVIHKVVYKDQLTEISKKYYGTHKEWKRIYEANKDKIKNPHLIFPGQEFIIPGIKK